MKIVRHTLTEILLDVTNEMISEISNETIMKFRKKGKIKLPGLKVTIRVSKIIDLFVRFLINFSILC
jgi:hypothetical protein